MKYLKYLDIDYFLYSMRISEIRGKILLRNVLMLISKYGNTYVTFAIRIHISKLSVLHVDERLMQKQKTDNINPKNLYCKIPIIKFEAVF